jgi:FtsP/CotA-like multicopper oxidase with cupredoxin domain
MLHAAMLLVALTTPHPVSAHRCECAIQRIAASAGERLAVPRRSFARDTPSAPLVAVPVRDTLASPPILENRSREAHTVEVTLTAVRTRLSLVPGMETDAYAYNGVVPGPTLEAREGDHVIIHFRNELPEETTVHWHGLHIPSVMDGSPFQPIPAGKQVDIEFTIPVGTAGTYWYHPHALHRAQSQVARGLYGALIVRADDDPLRSLPEKLLVLGDNRFRADGSVDLVEDDSPEGRIDFENGREGDVLFVNGQVLPTIELRPGEVQRWRVVNASAARVYRLAMSGVEMLHVGSDGGLFGKPIAVNEILVASSERVELLVRGTGAPGSTTVLQDLPYDRYIPQTRPADWKETRELVRVQYTSDAVITPPPIPSSLRHIEPIDTTDIATTRVFVLTQGFINNKAMDMNRVDEHASLGTTEIWEIENLVGMDHPFHLHGFSFQVLDRNGVPEPYRSWKDTVNVPKHESVRVVVRFDDFPGKWMYHCHILEHEENGMMGILEIR